jgi:AraC-like DNA-binding protein
LHRWRSHARLLTHWLAVLSEQGSETITVDGRSYDIPSGSSYLIPPGRRVELASALGNRPIWAHFDLAYDAQRGAHPQIHVYTPAFGRRAAWLQPDAGVMLGVDIPVVVPMVLQPRFRAGLPDLVRRWQRGDALSVRRSAIDLGGLVLAVAEHVRGDIPVSMPVDLRLQRAEEAVRAGLGAGAGLETMAVAAGLGRSRFCELYASRRGVSPGTFIRSERLTRARDLLAASDLGIGEIAAQVGFADATVFGRFFRCATGVSPGAWRAGRARVVYRRSQT